VRLEIVGVRPASVDEWNDVWNACDYATYFHSLEWANVWQTYSKGKIRPEPLMVDFSDGNRVILPLSAKHACRGVPAEYHFSPGGTYGGWISSGQLTKDHALQLSSLIFGNCKRLVWRFNPYDQLVAESVKHDVTQEVTDVLDLTDGFDPIFKSWSKGHKSAANKARREGVTVREASVAQDWREYFEIYEDSLRRWGEKASSKYSWSLFEDLQRRKSTNIKLWLSYYDEQVVSGLLCFYAKNHVVYWHGASLEKYFALRPVHLGIHEVVRRACESGYRWFDFNPSGDHEGVRNFKKGFGTASMSCPVVRVKPWGWRVITSVANKVCKVKV